MKGYGMPLPRFLRRGQVKTMLNVSDEEITKLIAAGSLKPRYMPRPRGQKARALFVEHEVEAFVTKVAHTEKPT